MFKRDKEIIFAIISTLIILVALIIEYNNWWDNVHSLFLVGMIIGGYYKTKEGIEETIKNRMLNVEILMILAAIGAILLGKVSEGATLIVIFSISGALENYTKEKSKKELSKLIALSPTVATKIIGEKREVVKVEDLKIGDTIEVKPGERIPIDCKIIFGNTQIDNSALTGESDYVEVFVNNQLYSGSINLNSIIICEVSKTSENSMFQKIVQVVKEADDKKPRVQIMIEQYENIYVMSIILLSLFIAMFASSLFGIEQELANYKALVLLVVASPCAIMASVSSAVLATISKGARYGVLIKGGFELEVLSRVDAICFDKTGTLTNGKPIVNELIITSNMEEKEIISIINSFEKKSNHPLAKAICNYCANFENSYLKIDDFLEVSGYGVEGIIDGVKYYIGSYKYVNNSKILKNNDCVDVMVNRGDSLIYFANDHDILAVVGLSDYVRDTSVDVIKYLKDKNIKPIMITGDNENNAKKIASLLDIDEFYANTIPTKKMSLIEKLGKKYKNVCMVGDGINDAPALAKSDVSIAMGHGSEIAIDTADIVLMKNDLSKIKDIITMSKRLSFSIKTNLIFSALVIFTMIYLNLFYTIDLPTAVLIHEGSTILVILNGIRLLR